MPSLVAGSRPPPIVVDMALERLYLSGEIAWREVHSEA